GVFPSGVPMSAGYTLGVPRLGVPALLDSDASMGITNAGYRPEDKGATALPAAILVGSTFDPSLARKIGEAIGDEARIVDSTWYWPAGANLSPRGAPADEIMNSTRKILPDRIDGRGDGQTVSTFRSFTAVGPGRRGETPATATEP